MATQPTRMVWDQSGLLGHYLSDRLDADYDETNGFLIHVGDKLIGGVGIYDLRTQGITPQGAIVGAADSPRWFTRKNISDIAAMFFNDPPYGLGLKRLNSFITASNEHSIKITERIGFTKEGLLREAGPDGEDIVVLGMLKCECPWLKPAEEDDPDAPHPDNPNQSD